MLISVNSVYICAVWAEVSWALGIEKKSHRNKTVCEGRETKKSPLQSREFFFCFSLDTFNERKRTLAVTPNCFCSCVFPLQNIRSCRSFTGFEDSCQSLFTDKKTKEGSPAPLGIKNLIFSVFSGLVFFRISVHRLISYLVFPPSPVGLAPLGQKMSCVGHFCACPVPFLTG